MEIYSHVGDYSEPWGPGGASCCIALPAGRDSRRNMGIEIVE